ncbi:hypothetical protein BMETH_2221_0 [methanotrophic bacterial endosymbiont of Bathymodiolus sp.]|nr:hypothetical protein BMETH_2221_0 [methanotrophic bacterial endosymbiont of Bathymodiolus sp.]
MNFSNRLILKQYLNIISSPACLRTPFNRYIVYYSIQPF